MPYGSTTTPTVTFRLSGSSALHNTFTRRGLRCSLTKVGLEQELSPRRPRNDHERRLRRILNLLFGQVSRDERPKLSVDRPLASTRRMHV